MINEADPCADVIELVYLYLDGEIEDDDCARIRRHLDDCAPCLKQYGIEQEVKALVARSCGCEHAPTELRAKVMARLREVRLEVSQVEYRPD